MENETERMECLSQLNDLFEHYDVIYDPTQKKLFDDLNTLRAILMDPKRHHELIYLGVVRKIVREITSRISKFDLKKEIDINVGREVRDAISGVHRSLDTAGTIFRRWEKPSNKYYPRTGQYRYIDHLVEYIERVKSKADDSIDPLKVFLIRIQQLLQSASCRLVEIPKQRKEDEDLKVLVRDITILAYQTEHAIDLFLLKESPDPKFRIWYSAFWLQDIHTNLEPKILQLNADIGDVQSIIRQIQDPYELKIIALFNDIEQEKLDEILKGVASGFDIYTWVSVSSYKERKKEVFLQLQENAFSNEGEYIHKPGHRSSEGALKRLVKDLLSHKSYFIILKEVQDIEDLKDIRSVLPSDDYENIRILLTTHSPELINYCRSGRQRDASIVNIPGDSSSPSQTIKPTLEGEMVGFVEETKRVHELLIIDSEKKLQLISISGMAGQGKTTFARELYNISSRHKYFHRQAWCNVSQNYVKKELLLKLLGQVDLFETISHKNDDELTELLWRTLKGTRFLIVLDDIWSIEAWYDLKRCFPDDKTGSRIIFTTRMERFAQPDTVLQPLARLSDDESLILLQQEVTVPPVLFEIGKEIAKLCKGLPLSVVLTAGLLNKMEKRQDVWKDIAKNLSSKIYGDAGPQVKHILDLSYNLLPDELKPCFLYFGALLKDKEVPVQKLIRLWISEGFIKHSNSDLKSLQEDVADGYLKELIGRSLVTVSQEKSIGGVKSCYVHDLLREFALTKAREDDFLDPVKRYDEHDFPSSIIHASSKPAIQYYCHRVILYSKTNHFSFSMLDSFDPLVRSLIFVGAGDMSPSISSDIHYLCDDFKLLRILNFEAINIGNYFSKITLLLHLRYLAVNGTIDSIPPSIANLLNLETFYFKSLENKVVGVPDSIWEMEKLRHVHINDHASFKMDTNRLERSFLQENVQSLSTPSLSYGDHTEKILKKLPCIRKLKCIFLDSWNNATECNQFPVLEFLDKLESLKVFYEGKKLYPCEFNFPSNLKKLTLTNFCMPWSEISQFVKLCNLEVLKLQRNAFKGETWEMEKEEVFEKLKLLELDSLNLVEWVPCDKVDNFPNLERLMLHNCKKLKEIPPSIAGINTLLMIEVKWCSPSAAESFQEELADQGRDDVKIIIL